jgi:hypothetical protein
MNFLLRPRNWEPACGTERSAASANYMTVLPRVLGCRTLRRTAIHETSGLALPVPLVFNLPHLLEANLCLS